ncbi:MAG: class I SAM-dependent methyltransferase [Bacteroidetes bacterium]|nr:class I SAM-dependent methyltransferase [Bacteroidota bacterium]
MEVQTESVTEKHTYQLGFSEMYADDMYNKTGRLQKANKAISVLRDYLGELNNLTALDIGCSTGIMTNYYAPHFKNITGVDIDEPAVIYAEANKENNNSKFFVADAMNTKLPANNFDVIFCANVYEHVPDTKKMLHEISRLLKPGGVCYFAAGNRLVWKDGEYRLPLLTVVPKSWAHLYLKMLGKGNYYYETHFTYWTLKKMVSDFDLTDYTKKIIKNPVKYCATEMIKQGSFNDPGMNSLWSCHRDEMPLREAQKSMFTSW